MQSPVPCVCLKDDKKNRLDTWPRKTSACFMTQISSSYLVLSLEILSSRQALYWLPCVTLHYTNQPIVTGGTRPRLMASLSNNLKMKEFPSVSCFFALGSNSTAFVVLVCWHAHKYVIVLTAWRNPLRLKKKQLEKLSSLWRELPLHAPSQSLFLSILPQNFTLFTYPVSWRHRQRFTQPSSSSQALLSSL